MKLIYFIAATMSAITLFSCSKEKAEKENAPLHNYINEWDIVSADGTLNDYWVTFFIQQGNNGSVFTQKKGGESYPIEQISWSRIEKDSIKIEFAFKAFPNKWEIRALAYDNDQKMQGHYYMVDQNMPSQRVYMGAVNLKID
ncbi:MAG TPA: hypothetical protein VHM26_10225 [Chitinophagaceae bacterium]|jgi:hypothetical protein|nr:hypothetical protein [Chitinophagaceae bacterium]